MRVRINYTVYTLGYCALVIIICIYNSMLSHALMSPLALIYMLAVCIIFELLIPYHKRHKLRFSLIKNRLNCTLIYYLSLLKNLNFFQKSRSTCVELTFVIHSDCRRSTPTLRKLYALRVKLYKTPMCKIFPISFANAFVCKNTLRSCES